MMGFSLNRFTLLWCVLWLVVVLSDVAEAEMTFTPTNVLQLSLYQTAELRFTSNHLVGDPMLRVGDSFYFTIDTGTTVNCEQAESTSAENNFTVKSIGTDGYTGLTTITARSSVFTVASSYMICYNSVDGLITVRRSGTNGDGKLLVWPALYNAMQMAPSEVAGGQGPVNLTLVETTQEGRPVNQGFGGGQTAFLIACNTGAGNTNVDCSAADNLAGVCASMPINRIMLTDLRGTGTTSVTGSFNVPYVPSAEGYVVCVPYCYSNSVGCGTASTEMSYTVVITSSTPVIGNVVRFNQANPSVYAVTPTDPQAHELGYMILTGTDLTAQDSIRVIRAGTRCTSGSVSLLSNLRVGAVTVVDTNRVNVSFIAVELVSSPQVGRVCYRRASTPLWSSVLKNPASTADDFVINVLQPTGFTVTPTTPFIGQPTSISFAGTGLDATQDAAFLTSATNCNTISGTGTFQCILSGAGNPVCAVTVDPPSNQGLTLRVCYRKADRTVYAIVNGTIAFQDRNPVYTLTPNSLYTGQQGRMLFIGQGLSLTDNIQFVNSNEDCNVATPTANFLTANGAQVQAGTTYSYDVVGTESMCLQVCYKVTGSNTWSVARPQQMVTVTPECSGENLYVSAYSLRYTLPFSSVGAMETVTLTLSLGTMPSALKLVRATENCVLSFCDVEGNRATACALTQNEQDFVSSIAGGNANILAGSPTTTYVLCALNGGSSYIPVLHTANEGTAATYAFTTVVSNPTLTSHLPETWRVSQAFLSTTFTGTNLNSATDQVLAIRDNILLSTTANVCPTPTSVPATALQSSFNPSTETTSAVVLYSGSYSIETATVVHFCYIWSNPRRITYTGSINFAAPLPSTMTTSEAPSGGFRAGLPITLQFTSTTDPLDASRDSLYFFRFDRTTTPNPKCYCGSTCPESARVEYSDVPLTTGASTLEVQWLHPRGFNNYDFNAIYVVCYNVSGSGSVTYMGNLTVGMSQPTYYTASNTDNSFVVGYPITFQAFQLCVEASCLDLTTANDMQLIPEAQECYQLTNGDNEDDTNPVTEKIGTPTVTTRSYIQRMVVNTAGNYRLCYRLDGLYQELPSSRTFTIQTLEVGEADPSSFTSIPAAPSAGEFLTVEVQCSEAFCSSCVQMRLVAGARASCWEAAEGDFTSDTCPSTMRVEFPNQFLPEGDFTVCYGANMLNSRRVPGTLTVATANPSSFTSSSVDIFTNQDSNVTLTVVGTGLSVNDQIFMLTSIGYTCHDIRTSDFQSNDTLQEWFEPSFFPGSLVVNTAGTTVSWIVSNRDRRFGGGILSNPNLCDKPGESCTMQLCYMRAGATWAPVSIEAPPDVRLLPSDPSSAVFNSFPLAVGMYSSVKVVGRGLSETDILTVRVKNCGGADVTIPVGTATVNEAKTEWIGVVRFTVGGETGFAVCYTRGTTTTEIGDVNAGGGPITFIVPQLYYLYDSNNISATHEMRQYEELFVGASFNPPQLQNLELVNLIDENTECNYMPYYEETGKSPEFSVRLNLISQSATYFAGRLNVPAGTYALCMQVSVGLFRVTSRSNNEKLTVTTANPVSYTATPALPFPNQVFSLRFYLTGSVATVDDSIQIINGNLYDCGTRNTTFIADYPIVPVTENTSIGEAVGLSLAENLIGTSLTVCYRINGGTFATVPRDTLIENNLEVIEQIPRQWSTVPIQPQVERTLQITFMGNSEKPDFLQTTDTAYLVIVGTETEASCTQEATITAGIMTRVGINTVWTIPADSTVEGTYIVCYTSTSNGSPVRVSVPGNLIISALQSPVGIFVLNSNSPTVYSGEQFYLMFDTAVSLDPVLSFDSDASTKDAVLFAKERNCQNPLTASDVAIIPSSFQYKDVNETNPSGIRAPYLHLVMRTTPGNLIVCMRRTGRTETEAFYNYEEIGDLTAPATVTVTIVPISVYTTTPTIPRAWVPSINVNPTYSTGYSDTSFSQLFFLNVTDDGIINDCYRPTESDAVTVTPTTTVILLNTTLQVILASKETEYPFPFPGKFQMCLQLQGANQRAASVQTGLLDVGNPSPTSYSAPEIISPSNTFTMSFTAIDAIFASTVINTNRAEIFVAGDDVVTGEKVPNCVNGETPSGGGTTTFNTFTAQSDTVANVQPQIMIKGYFFVCFKVYDQESFFPVPNINGGYLFSVGLTGAQRYTVSPYPAYMGEQLNIGILGNLLSSDDHVKIVDVTSLPSETTDYTSSCTAEAADANAESTSGGVGSVVNAISSVEALYVPRVNKTGRFILCYQSARLENTWMWVPDLRDFTVGPPQPNAYLLEPTPSYATEIDRLLVIDTSTTPLLGPNDEIKLVDRNTGTAGFDCTAAAENSVNIGALERVAAASNSTSAVYQVCANTQVSLTLCYLLAQGAWAEVPFQTLTSSYIFEPVSFLASPFTGPTLLPGTPQLYEAFTLTFTSSNVNVMVTFLSFALGEQTSCALNVQYVTPLYYLKNEEVNSFTVVLSQPGEYQMYLGTRTTETDPKIRHSTIITIASCDPCGFSPIYSFIATNVALKFDSSTGNTLSVEDTVRIVPVLQGIEGLPCDNPTGPFASLTLTPNTTVSTTSTTIFDFFTGNTTDNVGDYYICYRKSTSSSNFAIVTDATATPVTFSIYPQLPTSAVACLATPSYLQTVVFTFEFNITSYPKLTFSDKDEFFLLPGNVNCDAAGASKTTGVIQPVFQELQGNNKALWFSTLPNGHSTGNYKLCFRLETATVPHDVTQSALSVSPQDPARIVTVPAIIAPETASFNMFIYGTELSEEDNVFVVDASQRCDERCGETLTPTQLPTAVYSKTFVNASLVELSFTSALGSDLTLAVCYRRTGSLLVRLAVYFIGNRNPTDYNTNFVPRVGTRPLLTFVGTDLSTNDRVIIVDEGVYCDEALAASTGTAVGAAEDGTWSSFYLPLVGSAITARSYTVCYFVTGTLGYAQMTKALVVQSGGPNTFTTSNTPMIGRATVITVSEATYKTQVGDEAIVTCTGCSCFDGKVATLPYGTATITASVAEEVMTLRVGMNESLSYDVCYRVVDSGFAKVGSNSITPIPNSPNTFTVTPTPTLQGQRLTYNLGGFTISGDNANAPSAEDAAMLVQVTRLCWETDTMSKDGIIASPSNVKEITTSQSTWLGQVPSLGPGALPVTSFPMLYTLCYREAGQSEYVIVPFPLTDYTIDPANPSSFTTLPVSVTSGMFGIQMTFPNAQDGDVAYIVAYAGSTLTTNTPCDDSTSIVLTPRTSSYPMYLFGLPPLLSETSLVVCYIRNGATVAEVPELLALGTPNPSGYVTDAPEPTTPLRLRQYIRITFSGTNLDPTTDSVVFTDVACASVETQPPVSASFVRRISELSTPSGATAGSSVTLVVQFVSSTNITAHVCYRRETVWMEVGSPLSVEAPQPTTLTLTPSIGIARVGQDVKINLAGNDGMPIADAAVISTVNTNAQSWCHNFTEGSVQEPLLTVTSSILLDVPLWQVAGSARVCVQDVNLLWSDVALTLDGNVDAVIVLGPNPSSMQPFPTPPRVGQEVRLTFQLVTVPSENDVVRVTELTAEVTSCDGSTPIPGLESDISVTVDTTTNTSVAIPRDSTDPLKYSSFLASGNYKVCYYNAVEEVWSVAGGSIAAGTLSIEAMAPSSWSVLNSVEPTFVEPFVLVFHDAAGNLNASGDVAWAAPSTQSCGVAFESCTACIVFQMDVVDSTVTDVRTQPILSHIVGTFNLCYRLKDATAALIPPSLPIQPGEVECVVENSIRVGQETVITFKKRSGVVVTDDTWRVSFFGTTVSDCSSGYDPAFPLGRARMIGSNDTTVQYAVEWPVSMVDRQYLICYTHNGIARPVCTCDQMDAQTGECYVQTLDASPLYFVPNPNPTYVGQTIQLDFTLDSAMVQYPVTKAKFVEYKSDLTICNESAAFPLTDDNVIRVSATLYRFTFKHDYLEGPAQLIVCTLSEGLSANYARVGTMNPKTSDNLLILRPYMALTTFPTDINFLRAMQTINLTFTHESNEEGDVVGSGDRITFVKDPNECVESTITGISPSTVLSYFMLGDTSFSTIPAPVLDPSNVTRSSHVFTTFDSTNGMGEFYICYKLFAGTWAPIATPLDILPASVTSCTPTPPVSSPDNGNDGNPRAMQYLRTSIVGTAETAIQRSASDAVSVVPVSSPCINAANAVFISGVQINSETDISLIAFTPSAGDYKVCYRLGGAGSSTSNWSPVCTSLTFSEATPTGSVTGCFRLGQTLNTVTTHRSGVHFSLSDHFRFVPGTDQCIYVNDTETVSTTITVGDASQTIDGTAVNTVGTTFTIPNALLGAGTASLRLCYKDAVGNQYAVPLDPNQLTVSQFPVNSRLPAEFGLRGRVTAGQRGIVSFTANANTRNGVLVPYAATPPTPYEPGAVYDGKFDGATAIVLSSSLQYRDGRCYAGSPNTYGVYGNSTQTIGSFDPSAGGSYIACYRPMGCSVEDVQLPFLVGDYNPISWSVLPTPPRRGQLLDFSFVRNTVDSNSKPLSPGTDRAAAQTDLNSCWSLSLDAGQIVGGTTELSIIDNIIFPAQSPSTSSSSQLRVCYYLTDESWGEIPNGVSTLLAANPTAFTVLNTRARVSQINYIQFQGTSLGANDRVKIIEKANSCSSTSVPPEGMVSHMTGTGTSIPGSSTGWGVTNATTTQTVLNISATTTGEYSVCYKLEKDTVWTLVYGDLTIYERDPANIEMLPQTPLEGELFTLNFTSTEELSEMSAGDRVALYTGIISCLAPGDDADVIITSPSRTDLLPLSLPFQLASGTRGNHTLCYLKDNTIVWGFPIVLIAPNPSKYTTWPALAALRANQLISLIFDGFGLISESEEKTDKVKLISSTNTQSDEMCQTVESAANLVYYSPLNANGTNAVQVIRSPPNAEGSYWLCYKLNGGQYHIFPGEAITIGTADPSGATSSKGSSSIWNGESINWTIQSSSPSSEDGAFVFYSLVGCNDIPYYVVPEAREEEFPEGVATITNGYSLLRASPSILNGTTLSLCYYGMNTITMLEMNAVQVVVGIPPALETPLSVKALEIFQFTLSVTPTTDDYLVLLSDPNRCVGQTAPSPSSDAFIITTTDNSNIIATTAVIGSGTFYICYSHRIDRCAAGTSQECARIVGEIVASTPNPSGWSMSPSTVYTSDLAEITLSRPSGSNSESINDDTLWLTPISTADPTMSNIASACMEPLSTDGNILLQRVTSKNNVWNVRLNITGRYGLCYKTQTALMPTIFPPIENAGLEVYLTNISLVTFAELPTVGTSTLIVLQGRGLSQDDQLVAVGVPSTTELPNDICSNNSYTPRVLAEDSKEGYGLNSMVRVIRFELTRKYVLCFQAAASQGPMILITPTSFDVNPRVLSVRVVSVALNNTPLVLEFRGSGLRITDLASLVYLEDGNNDICATASFTAMTSTNAEGTISLYTTVPTQVGLYGICFKEADALTTTRLPDEVNVGVRNATGAVFSTLPVCSVLSACSPQPVVSLIDAAGKVTLDQFATVVMRLKNTDGTFVDELLSGGNIYTQKDYSVFYFLSLTISTVGEYIMEAHFTLLGGVEIVAQTPAFTVTNNSGGQIALSAVTCQPVGIINRPLSNSGGVNTAENITCVIQTKSPLAPTAYNVQLNAGTSTEVVPGDNSGGFPQYLFTVFPPFDQLIIQFVSIVVTPEPPLESWPVENSPVIVRIGSQPGPQSRLSCESTSLDLPSPSMVRVSDYLICHAQGRSIINGMVVNIVASPEYIHIIRLLNDDEASATEVNIGDYPESLDGDYVFNVTLQGQPLNVSVLGSVSSSETNNVNVAMQGSPSMFTVIDEPQESSSSMLCQSVNTMSTLWFVPVEPFICILNLGAEGHPVNGLPQDFSVIMEGGGSAQPINNNTWGTTLTISAAAPPIINSISNSRKILLRATSDQVFSLGVTYMPLNRPIASSGGTLVYVTSIEGVSLRNGRVTLLLIGSGLSTQNKYGIRPSTDCASGVSVEAVATPVTGATDRVELNFPSPNEAYFFCFAPSDQLTHWQLLSSEIMNQSPSSSGGIDRWVALFIVSVILLFILFVLLILLLWRVCVYRRRAKTMQPQMQEIYMRPPANNRFIRRAEVQPQVQQQQPQVQQQQPVLQPVETSSKGNKSRVRVNIHERNHYGTDLDIDVNGEKKHISQNNTASHRSQGETSTKRDLYSDIDGNSSSSGVDDGPRYIPPVPPPVPPRDDIPEVIGSVQNDVQNARVVTYTGIHNNNNNNNNNNDKKKKMMESSSPPSGPYQHLHHKVKAPPPQENEKEKKEKEQEEEEDERPPQLLQHPLMIRPSSVIESPSLPASLPPPAPLTTGTPPPPPPIITSSTSFTAVGTENEASSFVGPFVVKGHTSRPMVSSKPSSSSGASRRGGGGGGKKKR